MLLKLARARKYNDMQHLIEPILDAIYMVEKC